jgi:hypothetical protein
VSTRIGWQPGLKQLDCRQQIDKQILTPVERTMKFRDFQFGQVHNRALDPRHLPARQV